MENIFPAWATSEGGWAFPTWAQATVNSASTHLKQGLLDGAVSPDFLEPVLADGFWRRINN